MVNQTEVKSKTPTLEYQRIKDREPVKGIFKFYEVPGGNMSFNFKKYKKDPIEKYTLYDGMVYTIPLGVAKHLNKNGSYPIHKHAKDENGKVSMRIGQKVNRFGFQSLEFMDVDDLPSHSNEIVKVDQVADDKMFRKK